MLLNLIKLVPNGMTGHISKIERYLYEELKLSMTCYWNSMISFPIKYEIPKIFESLGRFENCGQVVKRVIHSYKEGKSLDKIDCSDLDVFFKYISITIKDSKNEYAKFDKIENDIVYITCYLNEDNDERFNILRYYVLHECMHAYESYWRKKTGKNPIESEMTKEYKLAKFNLADEDEVRKHLAECKYFLDYHERIDYLGTLDDTVSKLVRRSSTSFNNLNFETILKKLRKEYIWEKYVNINIFIDELNNASIDVQNSIMKKYNSMFGKIKDSDKLTFNQIKKLINKQWELFKKKFMEIFSKSYCNSLTNMNIPESFNNIDIYKNM